MTTRLPQLSTSPIRHPSSCCSLSLPLLSLLDTILPPPPSLALSIGSGPGLLEALLLHHYPARSNSIYGVEVSAPKPVNVFLPEQNTLTVTGTWAVVDSGLLKEAGALLFVYPRQPSLVQAYLARWEGEIVVWIGPRADMEEFGPVFDEWAVDKEGEDMRKGAVEAGEGVWVYRRV
ncbi:hypothetical protein QC763_606705 [Podospora pseudopauciseta]|uniref:Uncharacterized protein n=2 Tax=Podospora TaxID=5144 RepID=A0ABR0H5T9_9PEZI|nr:hypothetical protein QC763_606705 [Podospora pseudopauciseta]KAK4671533.1 hypothetical protein QC764_606705 [Podospora pseudoanserina]